MVLTANNCEVTLRTSEERKRWTQLVELPYRISKYPCPTTLQRLGVKQCFDELCEKGQLTALFTTRRGTSYQRLTLEFLATLEVEMNRRDIVAIKFSLRNHPYRMTMGEFKELYGFTGVDFREPFQFKKSIFWKAITTKNEDFHANRAKGSLIRNPVLRLLQKACVCHPFARHEQGSVQKDELFLLWSILNKQPMNLGHYMIKHLQRASKKKTVRSASVQLWEPLHSIWECRREAWSPTSVTI